MTHPPPPRRSGEHLVDQHLDLGVGPFSDTLLGCRLDGCTLKVRGGARASLLAGCTLRRCRIEAVGITSIMWRDCSFEHCVFTGRFRNLYLVRDGRSWTSAGPVAPSVVRCDLRNVQAQDGAFDGDWDVHANLWPNWPLATFAGGQESYEHLGKLALPQRLRETLAPSRGLRAIMVNLRRLDIDLDLVWAVLAGTPALVCGDAHSRSHPDAAARARALLALREDGQRSAQIRRRHAIWVELQTRLSIESIRYDGDVLVLALHQGPSASVANWPAQVEARMTAPRGCVWEFEGLSRSADGFEGPFRIMRASPDLATGQIVLGGHRRVLGVLRFDYDAITFVAPGAGTLPAPKVRI